MGGLQEQRITDVGVDSGNAAAGISSTLADSQQLQLGKYREMLSCGCSIHRIRAQMVRDGILGPDALLSNVSDLGAVFGPETLAPGPRLKGTSLQAGSRPVLHTRNNLISSLLPPSSPALL